MSIHNALTDSTEQSSSIASSSQEDLEMMRSPTPSSSSSSDLVDQDVNVVGRTPSSKIKEIDNDIRATRSLPPNQINLWPEETDGKGNGSSNLPRRLLRRCRHTLFYSYMGPILRHGADLHKQRKNFDAGGAAAHAQAQSQLASPINKQKSMKRRQNSNRSTSFTNNFTPEEDLEIMEAVKELSKDDVYSVPSSMEAEHLANVFWNAQKKQQQQAKKKAHKEKSDNSTISFLRILWTLSKPIYLNAALWQFIVVICQCSLPLLVREILLKLERYPGQPFRREGLPLAFAIFCVSIMEGIGNERQKFLSFQTGITLRSAVVSAAHGHVLSMTPRGRAGLTSGEIQNLVAVDAQKLFELAQEGHYSWSCPLAMIIVSFLLLKELGISALVGIVTMFLIVPFVQWVVRKMMHIRKLRVNCSDARVESTSAMLQGIRFTKLNRYEEKFIDRVMSMRMKEMKLLRKELFYLSLTIFATVVSPVVASGFTFMTFALMEEGNVLTPSTTFTSLFLFAALRFPINYAGKFMGKAAQGFQACHRFSLFFDRDSLGGWCESHGGDDGDDGRRGKIDFVDTVNTSVPSTMGTQRSMAGNGNVGGGSAMIKDARGEEAAFSSGNNVNNRSPLIDVNASFCVGTPGSSSSFTLSNITMAVHRSQIMCVVGPVASGKSTLVQGLIGELLPINDNDNNNNHPDSKFKVSGRMSYAAQIPFILNATVRDNILFGEPYDEHHYNTVLEACCLASDIETFHYGDLTEIGERGVTLSGGQKQRLSLARVAYSRPDVAILDDPLSALDAGTGKKVFERLFKPSGTQGLFANTAVVLVTHASQFLNQVDSMLVLVNGKSVFVGEWADLVDCHPSDVNEADAIEAIRTSVQEGHSDENGDADKQQTFTHVLSTSSQIVTKTAPANPKGIQVAKDQTADDDVDDGKIMSVEERKYGLSQLSTWTNWFKYAGGTFFLLMIVISMAFDRFMYVATEWWLAIWTQGAYEPVHVFWKEYPAQTDGMQAQYEYVKTYLIILLISCFTTMLRTNWIIQGGARCASRLFVLMLSKVLYAPMSYFDTTPVGRLMNRFTYDTETLDVTLVMNMTMLMTSLGWIVTGIILQSIILPWQLFAILFIVVLYWMIVLHYRKSAVDLQRLDATSRSPVQAQLAEAIDGTSTIRVFEKTSYFSNVFRMALDENSRMMMNFMAAQRWLAVRIQLLGACSVLFSVAFVASFNDVLNLDPGIAAILIIWSANFTISLSFFVQGIAESEASMTSLERVLAMTEVPQEEDAKTARPEPVDAAWPRSGDLTFDAVNLRYRPGLPLSLDGLTFTLKSGQRCGVVGRTGAGKSTLAAALFRLVELESGKIMFDGVDISKIGLANVRGRQNGMTIIPQEPVLLPGTLKQCLDPFGDYTDDQVIEALRSVRGASRGLSNINEIVEEGGRNFSVGERQLICLGRAMLAEPKLLFLDEATASVDGETDGLIQKMLRSRFDGATLLTIAHRLNTIMDYDVILGIDEGKAAEFGTPAELLSNKEGIFSQLVEATGEESAVALRSMVSNAT